MTLEYPTSGMIWGSKYKRSMSQGHKLQKGDRVASVSYVLYRVPMQPLVISTFVLSFILNKIAIAEIKVVGKLRKRLFANANEENTQNQLYSVNFFRFLLVSRFTKLVI